MGGGSKLNPTLVEEQTITGTSISFTYVPDVPFLIVIGSQEPRNHQKVTYSSVSGCDLTILSTWSDGYVAYSEKAANGAITINSSNTSDYGVKPIKGSLITLT